LGLTIAIRYSHSESRRFLFNGAKALSQLLVLYLPSPQGPTCSQFSPPNRTFSCFLLFLTVNMTNNNFWGKIEPVMSSAGVGACGVGLLFAICSHICPQLQQAAGVVALRLALTQGQEFQVSVWLAEGTDEELPSGCFHGCICSKLSASPSPTFCFLTRNGDSPKSNPGYIRKW
ncbi:hypothetical protein STEG23_006171, partial [Scotinomys teguina]